MPGRLSQASGFRQQGKHNRTSGAERSEIRREAVRPPPLQDAAPCPGLAHPGFHSKSSFVCFPVPSHQPMKIHRIIPEEPLFTAPQLTRSLAAATATPPAARATLSAAEVMTEQHTAAIVFRITPPRSAVDWVITLRAGELTPSLAAAATISLRTTVRRSAAVAIMPSNPYPTLHSLAAVCIIASQTAPIGQ